VPWSDVEEELQQYNYATSTMHKLKDLFHDNDISLSQLRSLLSEIPEALDGISELESIFGYLKIWGIDDSNYVFDIALARGLDYYTGPIFETKLPKHPHIGSLTGGGRYDTMIGMFTGKDLPAVGTTLGLDRIFTAMQQLDMLENVSTHTKVLIANFSASTLEYNLKLLSILRNNNIAAEIFPESSKLKKQFMYAERKGIRFMIIAGDDEVVNSMYNLKNLSTGEQSSLALEELIRILQ
jgi:histidyl-tRNA synthetase